MSRLVPLRLSPRQLAPIADLLERLADKTARALPAGRGPMLEMLRDIVEWHHHYQGPLADDCTACGRLRLCTPQGAAAYPLCLACYTQAVMDAAKPRQPREVAP